MRRAFRFLVVALGLAPLGCGDPASGSDAGPARRDAGSVGADADVRTDAGAGADAARVDDAGPPCARLDGGSSVVRERLRGVWASTRAAYETSIPSSLGRRDTTILYSLQLTTDPLLMWAEAQRDVQTIEELAALFTIALDHLETQTEAVFFYVPPPIGTGARSEVLPLPRPARMWVGAPGAHPIGGESVLDVAQFLAGAARIVRIATEVGEARSPALAAFARAFTPVIVDDTYARWIDHPEGFAGRFQRRGWACNEGAWGHAESVEHLIARAYGTDALPSPPASPVSYCNAVTDTDLWILAGALEVLVAHRRDPELVPMSAEAEALLTTEAQRGAALIASRMSATSPPGAPGEGFDFDNGAFDDHADDAYAGDTDPSFPGYVVPGGPVARPPTPARDVGWDLSHARRWVHVFDSFRRFAAEVDAPFEGERFVAGLARQLAFGASVGACPNVAFTNYFDGTNGWYRVNYAGRADYGFAPWAMTGVVAPSGYGLWSDVVPELGDRVACAFAALDTYDDADPADARLLVAALPSLLPYGVPERYCGW
ncbi:MAG: hypothetical protein AB7S26_15505 [Sandaracinaceae bacterium]